MKGDKMNKTKKSGKGHETYASCHKTPFQYK